MLDRFKLDIDTINQTKEKSSSSKRFKKSVINIEEVKKFDFERGLVSINDEEDMFTNFFKYNNEIGYEKIEEYYLRYLYNDYTFLNDFELCELTPGDRVDRLLKIISKVQHIKYKQEDFLYIYKFNNVLDKKLHFFIKKSHKNYSLLLIDLYHLGIYGQYIYNGKFQKNSIEKTYKRYKNNTISLDDFKCVENVGVNKEKAGV